MNLQEAINVAWHARVNGLDRLTPEHIREAFAVFEKAGEALMRIEAVGNMIEFDGLDAGDAVDTIAGIMTEMSP